MTWGARNDQLALVRAPAGGGSSLRRTPRSNKRAEIGGSLKHYRGLSPNSFYYNKKIVMGLSIDGYCALQTVG